MDFSVSISVIMPTYNTEITMLKNAVNSILNQTFSDFEFIIIDDGSTNSSGNYLNSIQDNRVRVIHNTTNIGITKSLNIGLKEAKGKYIARMDADDISLPHRLEREFTYLESHPDIIVCGAKENKLKNPKKKTFPQKNMSQKMEDYRVKMLFCNPGPIHPTAMIRHEPLLINHILYDEKLTHAQDYGLWEELSHYGNIFILDEVLLIRLKHAEQITVKKRDIQIQCDKATQKKILSALLDNVSDAEIDMHYYLSTGYFPEATITPEAVAWYNRLIQANKQRHIYNQKFLEKRIILIKKNLIRHTFNPDMSLVQKCHLILRFLPFFSGVKMIVKLVLFPNHLSS